MDTRCETCEIKSHDGISIPAIAKETLYCGKSTLPDGTKRVLIDEGQFFSDLAVGCVYYLSLGIDVYVAALNGTSERKPWQSVSRLIPHVDKITHLSATRCSICRKRRAPFTAVAEGCVKSTEVEIGGADKYIPVCRYCTLPRMVEEFYRFVNTQESPSI